MAEVELASIRETVNSLSAAVDEITTTLRSMTHLVQNNATAVDEITAALQTLTHQVQNNTAAAAAAPAKKKCTTNVAYLLAYSEQNGDDKLWELLEAQVKGVPADQLAEIKASDKTAKEKTTAVTKHEKFSKDDAATLKALRDAFNA
jgi:hypothetical protein